MIAPSRGVYELVFVGRSGEAFPSGVEINATIGALEPMDEHVLDRDLWAIRSGSIATGSSGRLREYSANDVLLRLIVLWECSGTVSLAAGAGARGSYNRAALRLSTHAPIQRNRIGPIMPKMSSRAALRDQALATETQLGSRRRFIQVAGTLSLSGAVGAPLAPAGVAQPSGPGDNEGVFDLGNFVLQSGATLREAKLAFKTHGQLNAEKSNVIVYPTPYSAHHSDIEWPIGPGKALDPERYFIIVPDMLGNGLSSSPSNTAPPYDRARFPDVTIHDNVVAQHRLVTEGFGISRIALVVGWSMGAQQTFQWAVSHPEMVARIAPFCGTSRTTPHNLVFLEGVKAALTADAAWMDGWYEKQPTRGIRAFARVYAGWGFSQPFYKQELYRQLGFSSLEDFLIGFWERRFLRRDANNLLAMLWTWQHNDLGATPGYGGSMEHALGSIRAKTLVMAGETDLYFTPADIEYEASHIPGASFRVIPSIWGHQAGNGLNPVDSAFIDAALKSLLVS